MIFSQTLYWFHSTQRHLTSFLLFIFTLILGMWILYPHIQFQGFLSTGDHGRDLYAFKQTLNGAQAYQDYWWVYGPLMPYYYSLFYVLLGTDIQSILIGKMILNLISGLFIYFSMSLFFMPLTAVTAAVWFWSFQSDFFFTYNHAGGITFLCIITFALLGYLKKEKASYLILGLISIFLLSLVKVNFAFSSLLGFIVCVWGIDKGRLGATQNNPQTPPNAQRLKPQFYLAAFSLPLVIVFCYWYLTKGLSLVEIRQCLPYLGGDQPYETTPLAALKILFQFIWNNIITIWPNRLLAIILNLSIVYSVYLLLKPKSNDPQKQFQYRTLLLVLSIFLILNLHEFLKSGVFYRYFWVKPFQVMLFISFIAIATSQTRRLLQILIWITLTFIAFTQVDAQHRLIEQLKQTVLPNSQPAFFLDHPQANVFIQNDPSWTNCVKQTTQFLNTHLKDDETFFALPYDVLYYYLTNKVAPTRQLIFFEHIKIPIDQEKKIIAELERKNVGYVLLSNRHIAQEQGLGIFGQTYCPMIDQYIKENYQPVAQFGDWQNEPGWAWNHGTLILKRKK